MIIARSPLRISIAGGATDLKSFYEIYEGDTLSLAINKYVYTLINKPLKDGLILKYSKIENVQSIIDIENPIIRECIRNFNIQDNRIEIITCADVPASSGLGGSSSFTNSLIKALSSYNNIQMSSEEIANMSCKIEIDDLGGNLGKQDQYISSYGGLRHFHYCRNGDVNEVPIPMSHDAIEEFAESIVLFFTGYFHNTNTVLSHQVNKTKSNDKDMINNLLITKNMVKEAKNMLINGDINGYGELTNQHWINKRKRSPDMSNEKIDEWYNLAIKNGAIGGKLVGAGGAGGFLMFVTNDKNKLRKKMNEIGLQELRFGVDFEGTKRVL